MNLGEVWLVALPSAGGHEQSGHRPAIIIQDAVYGQGSPLVLVVPLTSRLAALRFPATVSIAPTAQNGLTLPSVAMVFQARALDRQRFTRLLGHLEPTSVDHVLDELARLTSLRR